jgi:hypothetical protein
MKSKIVSIPIGMLSNLLKVAVVTKNIWNPIKETDAIRIKVLKAFF